MQHITNFILGLVFLTASCGQADNKATNKSEKQTLQSSDSLQTSINLPNRDILGVWTNCATSSGGVTMTANVCKMIEFKSDNSAIITYPSQEKQVVNWTLTDDLLLIRLTGDKSAEINRTFTDSIYEARLTQDSISFDLELKAKNKDVIYYLGRQK